MQNNLQVIHILIQLNINLMSVISRHFWVDMNVYNSIWYNS